jgi:hypothetical protein
LIYALDPIHKLYADIGQAQPDGEVVNGWAGAVSADIIVNALITADTLPRAITTVGQVLIIQKGQSGVILSKPIALVDDLAVPVQGKCVQSLQYLLCCTRWFTAGIKIFHTQKPAAVMSAGIQKGC